MAGENNLNVAIKTILSIWTFANGLADYIMTVCVNEKGNAY